MLKEKTISLTQDFSRWPAGRNEDDYCGLKFFEDLLLPALDTYDKVTVHLDGTLGLSNAFLEGAFLPMKERRPWTIPNLFIETTNSTIKHIVTSLLRET